MYKKKSEKQQMSLDDFLLPFDGNLSAKNEWVKLSKIMPWEMIENIYASKFKNEKPDGRPPITARIAFGALFIQSQESFTDEKTLKNIMENPYMQYFLGLCEFHQEPLFDLSMMVHFRKRFTAEDIAKINEELYKNLSKSKDKPPDNPPKDEENGDKNKGSLVLDATVAPADVRYPTDLSLLNECRENVEKIIDDIWKQSNREGHKTPYSRKRVRRNYLKIAKQRRARKKQRKQAISEQLSCVEKGLVSVEKLQKELPQNALSKSQKERLQIIRKVAEQQKTHLEKPRESIAERIVNLRQPHVHPIVRGKVSAPVEFGQKLAFSVVEGFTFIDKQSWSNFNEGITLIASAEKYRARHGFWPEAILADTIYRNRENRRFCKEQGIRLSGPRLGRPKAAEIEANKEQAYRDSCARNIVESRNGIAKRRYGLDRIFAILSCTAETAAAMIVFAMNAAHLMRIFLCLFMERCFLRKLHPFWNNMIIAQ